LRSNLEKDCKGGNVHYISVVSMCLLQGKHGVGGSKHIDRWAFPGVKSWIRVASVAYKNTSFALIRKFSAAGCLSFFSKCTICIHASLLGCP